jgi:hypothetical protein
LEILLEGLEEAVVGKFKVCVEGMVVDWQVAAVQVSDECAGKYFIEVDMAMQFFFDALIEEALGGFAEGVFEARLYGRVVVVGAQVHYEKKGIHFGVLQGKVFELAADFDKAFEGACGFAFEVFLEFVLNC